MTQTQNLCFVAIALATLPPPQHNFVITHQSSSSTVDGRWHAVGRPVAKVIRTNVAGQVDVASFSGKVLGTQAHEAILSRLAGRAVLARVRVAEVDLSVARVPRLHASEADRASARIVLDRVDRSKHQGLGLVGLLLVPELQDGGALLEVEARLADADVVVERQELEQEKLLEQVFVEVDPLLDVSRVKVLLVVGSRHRGGEGDVQDLGVAFDVVRLDAENLDLTFVARDDDAQTLDEVLVERGQEGLCCDIGQPQRHRILEHLLGDVVEPQPEVGSGLILAVGDADADFGLDVDVGLDGRGKTDLPGPGIELQQVGVVPVREVVLELARWVSI